MAEASTTSCPFAFVKTSDVPEGLLDMASSCAGPISKIVDDASSKATTSCYSGVLGDANGDESNCGDADNSSSGSGVGGAEQPVTTDPSHERVNCAPVPYGQEDADSGAEPEDAEVKDHEDAADKVLHYPEFAYYASESEDDEHDDEDDEDNAFYIQVTLPLRPPGQ